MTSDRQRAVMGRVLARWRDRHGFYRAAGSGERVTLASLFRAGVLARRCWRGRDGAANAAYEYWPSNDMLTELARLADPSSAAALMPQHGAAAEMARASAQEDE